MLDQLVQSGLLETVTDRAIVQVRFAYDAIAEYLGAMHVVAKGPETVAALRARLKVKGGGLEEALERVEESRAAA